MIKKFYLKLLMSLMLVALAVPQMQAETLTIANTTNTDYFVPLYGSWMDDNGTYSQTIYTFTQLEDVAGQQITRITYYPQDALSSNFAGAVLKVSLKEVSESGFSSTTRITDMTECGTVTLEGGETEVVFDFDTPFDYSGNNNLAVEVSVQTGAGYSTVNWLAETTSGSEYCSLYHYNTTTQRSYKVPMTQFTYGGGSLEEYAAKVTPNAEDGLAFGALAVGGSKTLNVTLKNTGANAFTPSVSVSGTGFSTTYSAAELASKASVTIPVVFAPTTDGDFTGTLTINCGAAGTFTYNLTGSGSYEVTASDGTTTNGYLPVYGNYFEADQINQMIYPASMLSGLEGKMITSMTFYPSNGILFYKTSSTNGSITFSLGNLSANTAGYASTPERQSGYSPVATIVMPENTQPSLTAWTIEFDTPFEYTGGDLLIDVETDHGQYGNTSFYGSNQDGYQSYYSYKSSYSTTYSQSHSQFLPKVTFTYEEAGPRPVITVDPTTVDAFSTEVGTPVTATVNVTGENLTGDITAAISGANADCFTAALENGVLTITYNPTAAGEHTATVTLSSPGAQNVTIALNGTSTAPAVPTINVNPATLTINAALGETKTATFTVTGANLEGDITVAASEGFTVAPTTIAAADAATGATVTVTYVAPSTAETKTGTITLTSEGAEAKTVTVNASAADITYDFTVDEESLNFGEVYVGQNKTLSVKITNNGSETINPVFTFNNNVFSVEDASYGVFAEMSQTYNIVYTPAAVGTDNGTVTISVGRNSVTVDLTGKGIEQADYDIASSAASGVHNFGDVFKDGFATWNVTLTNNGAKNVTPVIEGLATPFSAENVPATIAAGKSTTITFKFAPTEIKAYGPISIVVKFNETEDFQFDFTFRGNGIENTGTLPPSTFDNYSYTWTDKDGNEHTSLVSEIATEPQQMIALLREVYTNKNFPGPYYRGYDANGNVETGYPVPYPAIGTVTRFGAFEDPTKYTYNDAYGWEIPHDETAYPFQLLYHNSSSHNHYKALNGDEYKPYEEGLTLLLVEMKDGANSSTVSREISSSNTLINIFDKMFKSVRVITNSKRVTKDGVDGTLFKIDCDKMNRFFFLGKGRLRLMGENDVDNTHLLGRSNYFNDKDNQTSSTQSISNVANDGAPFFEMFEQFSPVSLIEGTESNDVYQELVNMQSYLVEHDCVYIPWAPAQVSGGQAGHEFNMYGKESISDDCQDVRDLMFFVPDQRMMAWGSRDRGANDKFVNYYEENAPTMGLYVIVQNEITGEQIDGQDTYRLHLTWDSNLTDFVPSDKGVYYIYQVNDDGTYTKVGETNSQTKELYLNVDMQEHGQQVTYVIQGQDNTGFLSLQMSNEESFIIPGLDPNEKFQMMPGAEYYSRFDPQTVQNFYANGMQIMAYPDATTSDYAGQTFNFYRKAAGDADWTLVGTAEVNNAGTEATVSMVEATQRQQSEYKFGYKQNPATVAVTTDANGNKVFGVIFDNFKADVSTNEHPSSYSYKMEVANTSLHSNEMSIKVYKTQMRNLTGTFNEEYVNNDEVRQDVDNNRQFDIDVEHSSKTEILRYGAYRWDSSYGDEDNPFAILNLSSDDEEDISPSGQASNQGEFYSVYMNGDSYIGDDVYVAQGETGQATFVDDVPATTNAAEEYTYAPVIETFTGRPDYNTYGAPMQTTATGKIIVTVENAGKSEYTWKANGNTYRYYNVFVDVNTLDLPAGYEVAKVRAWRKIDASYLNEKLEAYSYRAELDANGEFMFDDPTTADNGDKLGSEAISTSGPQGGAVYKGTFGALDVENGATVPMKFFVRIYFKKSSKADGDKYYITEVEIDGELNSQIPTSIFGVESYKVVTGIKYYNMAGMESDVPFKGVNIEVTTYDDGSRTTRKIMK